MKRVSRNEPSDTAMDLLRKLSGSSALPAYVRQLPAATVSRLIEEVGLEDSHEIIAALETEQFRETMSLALWSSAGPGHDEVLDVDQLVRWIGLWLQDGDAMVSRRIGDLGEDFTVACFEQLLVAVDRTRCGVEREGGVDVGNYVLFPKQQKHWPRVVEAIVALWSEVPDFTLRVLRRCSHERSILNESFDERAGQNSLADDFTAERSARRAQAGHVSPTQASLFLSAAKTARLDELYDQREYDLNTAAYLQQAARPADVRGEEGEFAERATPDALLRDAEIKGSPAAAALLTSPHSTAAPMLIEQAIAALAAEQPHLASKRMRELAYLANVLMSGAESQGKRYTEVRAVRAVVATANLGTTHLLRMKACEASDLVRQDPGLVRLFQVGFNLLSCIPSRCCQALYFAREVQSKRRGHVVHLEMQEILGASLLTDLVNEGRYAEAKSVVDELSAVMDSAACVALRILIDPIPAYPLVLGATGTDSETYIDRGYRSIATLEDFERIGAFLTSLADYCGN